MCIDGNDYCNVETCKSNHCSYIVYLLLMQPLQKRVQVWLQEECSCVIADFLIKIVAGPKNTFHVKKQCSIVACMYSIDITVRHLFILTNLGGHLGMR